MAIRGIFFDAAGTLIQPVRRVGESYALLAKKYGVEISAAESTERFRICFDEAPPLAFPGAAAPGIDALEREWWKALVRHIFEPHGRFQGFDDYFAELFDYFARPGAWSLYPEVAETLPILKNRGLTLDVISNFDSRLIGIMEGLGAARWFDHIFVSSRVGYAKPAQQIFAAALEHRGLEAGDALHVGDSRENDFHGALNAGLKSVLVERSGEDHPNLAPRIATLKAIPRLLDHWAQREK
jgi:putative hydrolase of the HAD superfamily